MYTTYKRLATTANMISITSFFQGNTLKYEMQAYIDQQTLPVTLTRHDIATALYKRFTEKQMLGEEDINSIQWVSDNVSNVLQRWFKHPEVRSKMSHEHGSHTWTFNEPITPECALKQQIVNIHKVPRTHRSLSRPRSVTSQRKPTISRFFESGPMTLRSTMPLQKEWEELSDKMEEQGLPTPIKPSSRDRTESQIVKLMNQHDIHRVGQYVMITVSQDKTGNVKLTDVHTQLGNEQSPNHPPTLVWSSRECKLIVGYDDDVAGPTI